MAVIAEGSGTIPEGPGYRWTLEDTPNDGSRVSVRIDVWSISRDFPTVLQSDEASKVADDLAPGVLALNNSKS